MKKLLLPFILIVLVAGGGYWYYEYTLPDEKPQILKLSIQSGSVVEVVNATGSLDAMRTVTIGSQVSGIVQDLYVDFNYMVKQGEVLARIDPTLFQSQVDQAQANLDKAKVDLEKMKVDLKQNLLDEKRNEDLAAKKLVTQQILEQAHLTVADQNAAIASAEKGLVQTEGNLQTAKTNLGYTVISSPIDGVVVNRLVDKGSTVQASMTAPSFFLLATDLTTMKLTGGVDEAEIGKVHPGQLATFTVDAYQGQTFSGTVNSVRLLAVSTNNVVTYGVVMDVLNPELKLRPGMTATIKIQISRADDVLRVPNAALRFRPTNDMYAALGLTPPVRGGGPGGRAGGGGANAQAGTAPAAGAPAASAPGAAANGASAAQGQMAQNTPPGDQAAPGQGGGRGNNRTGGGRGGQGGGRGNFGSTLTPEQQKQMAEIMKLPQDERAAAMAKAGLSGRGGGGGGRGNGQRGATANQVSGPVVSATQMSAMAGVDTIDKLYLEMPRVEGNGTVWVSTEDPVTKKVALSSIRLRTGITDGQWTEIKSGDVQVGQEVLTAIIVKSTAKPGAPTSGNPLMPQPQQNRGGGPGGGGPGGGGGGGGGRGGGL